jgi:hypothetical protein
LTAQRAIYSVRAACVTGSAENVTDTVAMMVASFVVEAGRFGVLPVSVGLLVGDRHFTETVGVVGHGG